MDKFHVGSALASRCVNFHTAKTANTSVELTNSKLQSAAHLDSLGP